MTYLHEYASPIGILTLTSDGHSLTGLWMGERDFCEMGETGKALRHDLPVFEAATTWLDRYFAGEMPVRDFPLAPAGTPFRLVVWKTLETIPYGRTRTYSEIAAGVGEELGRQVPARPVGGAIGHNPIGIIIPCHRVIGADGSLTGFAGGLDKKAWLLMHEKRRPVLGPQ
ncbi:MAG: methylated-DNA--[protein]-cysteine S-methyltransferase [Planctomycetaceae bacterium]|nr:methylated-DNA--[protein]-cysteine S-methyltransferase [Planctomycetaceae bacterium]